MRLGRRRITNFGGNVCFVPAQVYQPRTADELLDCMRRHPGERMRCIGAGHSWSEILATDGVLFDLRFLEHIEIEAGAQRVRVGAGCTIGRLLRQLRRRGKTLPTVGAIKKQTIAGAIATGTHGSGAQSLSHFVEEVRIATFDRASGGFAVKTFAAGAELEAARCALGSLGIVVEVVLQIENAYRIEERTEKTASIDDVLAGLEGCEPWDLQQFALIPWSWRYLVYRRRRTTEHSFWLPARICRWANFVLNDIGLHLTLKLLLLYAGLSKPAKLAGLKRFTGEGAIRAFFRQVVPRSVIAGPRRVDDSTGILTMRHDLFRHVEMEAFVPDFRLREAIPVVKEIVKIAAGRGGKRPELLAGLSAELREEVWKLRGTYTLHYVLFFRRVLADATLVSMSSARGVAHDWYSISFFTYGGADAGYGRFSRTLALCLAGLYGARLHWGKYFPISQDAAAAQFPRFAEFRRICLRYDPKQQFWY